MLFEGLNDHGRMRFEVSVLAQPRETQFMAIADLFWPTTIDKSIQHDGVGLVEGRRGDDGGWSVAGHRDRILRIDTDVLALFASLYDEGGTPALRARMPVLRARGMLDVLQRFAAFPATLASISGSYATTEGWHETNAVHAGTIRRETAFGVSVEEFILSGPHVYVANPWFKTPRTNAASRADYDAIDLNSIASDYLPRSNYVRDCDPQEYRARKPRAPWNKDKLLTDFPRLVSRCRMNQSGERTLLAALYPAGPSHIDACFSLTFANLAHLLRFAGASASLPLDFFVKTTGKGHFRHDIARQLPLPVTSAKLFARTLLLNCLTSHYSDLWNECFDVAFTQDRWAKEHPLLAHTRFSRLAADWSEDTPLRHDYERRHALVEIDVLVSMGLGLTVDELCNIYRIQFPVLRQYERNTWYDRNGRIVYLDGDQAYGLSTPEWKIKRNFAIIERIITDDTKPGGPRERTIIYEGPFNQCDREEDYRTAWAEFARRQA
jgi:hypothetical protein